MRRRREQAPPDPPLWATLSEIEEYEQLCRVRLERRVEVREPLVLISQIQRSGGTLLSQFLDGHPECHADPYEIKIGHPKKHRWPSLDLSRPDAWFELLFDDSLLERVHPTERTKRPGAGRSVFPFVWSAQLQKAIFDACVAERRPGSEREVLDCYFTSYFNAWLDNHNLYTGPKRVVTGFTPRLAMEAGNVERFFAAYPDGALISIVRDPCAWYASASRHFPERWGEVDAALGWWRRSTEATLSARERFGERVVVLTYERLVLETEAVMGELAERVGISMLPSLLVPTFNGLPIRANSSERVGGEGVRPERVAAYRESLGAAIIERIEELAGDLYGRAEVLSAR